MLKGIMGYGCTFPGFDPTPAGSEAWWFANATSHKSKGLPAENVAGTLNYGTKQGSLYPMKTTGVRYDSDPYWYRFDANGPAFNVKLVTIESAKVEPPVKGLKGLSNHDAVEKLIESGNRYILSENYQRLSNLLGGV